MRSVGLERALSKLGYCSRSQAQDLIRSGRVQVNGAVKRNPEAPVFLGRDRIEVNGASISARIERAALAATLLNSMFSSSLSEIFERTEQGRPYATKITCAFVEHEFRETPRPPTVKLRRVQIAVKTVRMEIEEESQ